MPAITLPEFVAKWAASTRTERAAAQEHFIDLCRLLGRPAPNKADPTGDFNAFEKGAAKAAGGQGFADVWRRGPFAWEYKRPHKNLQAARRSLPPRTGGRSELCNSNTHPERLLGRNPANNPPDGA